MKNSNKTKHKEILSEIHEAISLCEEYCLPIYEQAIYKEISETIIPCLFDARTYIEVGFPHSPSVNLSISEAMFLASDLTDKDPKFSTLLAKLRLIKEHTNSLSNNQGNQSIG
ncbi:MAG: hypothetical protein CL780_02905 [Chloroflexi bacterium]|nr:hypothetical protein [Chloroflexota bacterium]|tara:strand:- start:1518 stop:1856 length:339 start_codon:yes stop_codon:yes gene_type:complete